MAHLRRLIEMSRVRGIGGTVRKYWSAASEISNKITRIQEALGRIEQRQILASWNGNVRLAEFRAFSQWGEDGIIQALLSTIPTASLRKVFVEFGVENYTESNTRFLLVNDNWSGLVIDGSEQNVDYIRQDPIYWQHNLKAECRFITRDNINELIKGNGISGDIGLLSVDIDGNDYWVWERINCITPAIVITEYNARFGPDRAVTVPYAEDFQRAKAHQSMIYYGASLKALTQLANRKGYALIGCNSAGNNAFFVRRDLVNEPLKERSVAESFVRNQFRETRDAEGRLIFLGAEEEGALLATLPLVDVGE
jgi:hypothetical protein